MIERNFQRNPTSITSRNITYDVQSVPDPLSAYGMILFSPPVTPDTVTIEGFFYNNAEKDYFEALHAVGGVFAVKDHNTLYIRVLSMDLEVLERRPTPRNPNRYSYTWTLLKLTNRETSTP